MAKTFVLHDESVNTRGFRMLTSGCNLEEFKKNPVILYMHNDYSRPIGRWENIRIDGTQILADAIFDEEDKRENGGAEISSQVERDFIRMASIGAWPPEEVSVDDALMIEGQKLPTVTKWTAREASIVTVGSNHNALAFYDRETGEKMEMKDVEEMIRLMDKPQAATPNNLNMDELNKVLNLADTATADEQVKAVNAIIAERDSFKKEKEDALVKLQDLKETEAKRLKDESVALVDEAIKDGRIDASAKESFISLFDSNYEAAKATLNAIPKRTAASTQLDTTDKDAVELADLKGKDWDVIDREGKQGLLKSKYPDLYEEKFEAKFGKKPSKKS